MNSLYHLSLEKEIVLELSPFGAAIDRVQHPTMRRETVLAMISRSAHLSQHFHELLNEAGLLAASAMEMEYFGYAEVRGPLSLGVGWGSVADSTRNVDPVPVEAPFDLAKSSFAFAIKSEHPILVADVTRETRFHDSQLIGHGIRSGVICPIDFRDEQFGAVGVFSSGQRALTRSDVMFVQSIALLLGPMRAHQNTERTLAAHSRFLSTAIDALDAAVIMLDDDGVVAQINRACLTLSGFAANELRGRAIWSAFCSPADGETLRATLNKLRHGSTNQRCDLSLITKLGETRRISWTFTRLPGDDSGSTILATGIDITEQLGALSKMESASNNSSAPSSPTSLVEKVNTPENGIGNASERRSQDRRPYTCVQSIAPCVDGKLPDRSHLREVRCHDISSKGFSFLLASKPDFNELVAAFGSEQSQIFLRARVVHSTPFRHEGRNVILVGCEYTGRVRLPWLNVDATSA